MSTSHLPLLPVPKDRNRTLVYRGVDGIARRCIAKRWRIVCSCPKHSLPYFGRQNDEYAQWCKACPDKPKEAINILSPSCQCTKGKQPIYGLRGDKRPTWCSVCPNKPDNAYNIACATCPCSLARQPYFALSTDSPPMWCSQCPDKPDNTINVVHKRCPCPRKKLATFGIEKGGTGVWCAYCPTKPNSAVSINSPTCECPLAKRPSFGIEADGIPLWCRKCPMKSNQAVNVITPRCATCKLNLSTRTYRPECAPCYYHNHPEVSPPKAYRTRENHLFNRVKQDFPDTFRFDRPVDGGCSKRKPDLFVDCLTYVIIGEHDEHMHKYTPCENKRIMQLFEDTAARPIVIIRLNPDAYTDSEGVKHPSTFFMNNNTLCVDEEAWEARYLTFKDRLKHWLQFSGVPDKEVTVEQLYYGEA